MSKRTIVTHSGVFHPDDVFAVATLLLVYPEAEVLRSRDPEVISKGDIVVDVGDIYDEKNDKFDHHQKESAGLRDNGVAYSSFGLVWKKYGSILCGSAEVAKIIDETLVLAIDADDTGVDMYGECKVRPFGIEEVIYKIRPTWKEEKNMDESFMEAVSFAKFFLQREIKYVSDKIEGMKIVRGAYEESPDKQIIILDNNYPSTEVLTEYEEPLFLVKPDKLAGVWVLKSIPKSEHTFESRKLLPESWSALTNVDLQKVSGVSDAIMCHRGRWIAKAKTKEGALKLAQIALNS